MAKILRKLTIRDMIGGKTAILDVAKTGRASDTASEGSPVPLLMVVGHVTGVKPGEGDNGSFVKLMGSFEGTNLQTGEIVPDVGMAILPNFVSTQIASAIQSGAESVQFAVQIDVKYKESAAVGYEFEAKSLLPVQESDAIKAIKAQMTANGIALPQPVKTPQLAAPQSTAPTPAPTEAPKPAAKTSGRK